VFDTLDEGFELVVLHGQVLPRQHVPCALHAGILRQIFFQKKKKKVLVGQNES
jgi:hypothetical protein